MANGTQATGKLYGRCREVRPVKLVGEMLPSDPAGELLDSRDEEEPFILAYPENQINVYYSDQRDPNYGQKLCHQSSGDLMSWGPAVNDVAYANYTQRPGMITMAQIGNGKWMCSYEVGLWTDAQGSNESAPYATHYKIADSPLEFGDVGDTLLNA